jgi:hypothetical protein
MSFVVKVNHRSQVRLCREFLLFDMLPPDLSPLPPNFAWSGVRLMLLWVTEVAYFKIYTSWLEGWGNVQEVSEWLNFHQHISKAPLSVDAIKENIRTEEFSIMRERAISAFPSPLPPQPPALSLLCIHSSEITRLSSSLGAREFNDYLLQFLDLSQSLNNKNRLRRSLILTTADLAPFCWANS